MKQKLYCKFIDNVPEKEILDIIFEYYYPSKIFHFELFNELNSILSFNSVVTQKITNLNLLVINRNYHTNTLYTINAINAINDINWEEYENKFIFTRKNQLVISNLILKNIYLNEKNI